MQYRIDKSLPHFSRHTIVSTSTELYKEAREMRFSLLDSEFCALFKYTYNFCPKLKFHFKRDRYLNPEIVSRPVALMNLKSCDTYCDIVSCDIKNSTWVF